MGLRSNDEWGPDASTLIEEARVRDAKHNAEIKALADERDAALASLRNAKANVRDLQAQLEATVSQCAALVKAEKGRAEPLVSAVREHVYPSYNEGEPLERCLNGIGPHGRPTPDRCRSPRIYEFHCDEYRVPHEVEERFDAPMVRALEHYDLGGGGASRHLTPR